MGKLLKYAAVLLLAALAGFMYMMNEESFFTDQNKIALFNSYLKRASDPHEKRLRLVETKTVAHDGIRGKLTVTTLMFVDEKYYLNAFTKTYKLLLLREANINDHDLDRIEAGLYLDIDYGVRDAYQFHDIAAHQWFPACEVHFREAQAGRILQEQCYFTR